MKKKYFRFLLIALAVTTTGLVSSCKDYDEDAYEDLRSQVESDFQSILDKMTDCCNEMRTELGKKANQTDMETALAGKVDKTEYAEAMATLGLTGESKDALEQALQNAGKEDVASYLIDAYTTAKQAAEQAETNKDKLEDITEDLNNLIANQYCWSDSLKHAYETADDAYAKAEYNYIWLGTLDSLVKANDSIRALQDSILSAQDSILSAQDSILLAQNAAQDSILAVHEDKIDSLFNVAKEIKDQVEQNLQIAKDYADAKDSLIYAYVDTAFNELNERIDSVASEIDDLKDRLDAVEKTLDKMITSVVIQGAVNPVYGSFSIPAGITSNMLIAYYGESDNTYGIEFPSTSTLDLAAGDVLTSKDLQMLGSVEAYTASSGDVIVADEDDNAGKLFITVNPNTADLSDAQFSFVNSLDEEVDVTISDLVPSTEKLTFGWTRAGVSGVSSNGFYEANVKIEADQVEALKPNIDKDALKDVVKDVINFRNGVNLTNIAETMFDQFSGILDAYAVKAVWTDDTVHSVYSNYAVAVTAIKPLSYAFDPSDVISRRLPTISPISDQELFSFSQIAPVTVSFTIDGISTPLSSHNIILDSDNTPYIEYPAGNRIDLVQINDLVESINDVVDDNIEEVKTKINDWVAELNTTLNTQVTNTINGQLTDKINDLINDALDSANGTVNDYIAKANKWINRLNKVINRINSAFDNSSSKLQVTAVYEGQDGEYHQLSNSQVFPSVFTGEGGINIELTSYTAELVVPAMKKFVAVTNVFKGSASAQDGDADCVTALNAANSGDFGKVIDGSCKTVTFVPQSGYTYEIYYAGLDYSGKISARKFYVNVD